MSKVKEQEFHRNMQQLTDHHAAISAQLSKKEESLHDLTAESRELNALRQRYETKIKEMEREVAMVQAERDRVLSTLEVTEKDYHSKHQAITSEYETKLKLLNNNLKDYRDKIKENERLKRVHGADEQKIKQLVEEIAQTKKQRVALQNQINDKSKAHREWMESNRTKMESLQREASKSKLLLKKMTEQFEKQANVLKRRNEEKALLQRQIAKQNQTQKRKDPKSIQSRLYDHTVVTAPSTRLKLRTPLRNKKSPAKRVAYQDATLSDSAAPTITSASVDDLKSAVNEEIEKAVQRQQLIEDLHRLQTQRDTYMDHLRNDEHELLRDDLDEETRRTMEENRNSIRDSLKFVGDQLILNQSKLDDLAGFYSPIKKSNGRGLLTTDQIAAKLFNRNSNDKKEKEVEEKDKQDVDYRLFSRVRVGNLEASKSLILHLVEQAITLKASQLTAQQERQKLEIALAEARATIINEKIKNEVLLEQQRSNFKTPSGSTTTTPAGKARTVSKRTDEEEDDHTSHDIHDQTIRSPAKLKAAINVAQQMINGNSPQRKRNNYVEENGVPPSSRTRVSRGKSNATKETVLTAPIVQRAKSLEPEESEPARTHVDEEEEIIPDQRRSGSIGGGTGDVFSRLTDTHSYTGMYKTIHRDVEHHKPTGRKYASMPPGKKQRESEESGTSPSKNIPVTTTTSSAITSASLAALTTTPSPINPTSTFKAAKSVFTRLTDASQFPAAHRVRHGLEDTSANPSRTSMPPKPSHRSQPSISNGLPSTSSLITSSSASSAPPTASPLVIATTGLSRPQRVPSRQSRRNKSPSHRIRSPSDVDLDDDSDYYYDSSTSESSTTSKPTPAIAIQTLPTVTSPKSGTPRGYTSGSESDGIDMPSFHSDGDTPRAVHPTVASAIGQMMAVPPNIPRPKTSALTAALVQQGVIPMATPSSTSITPGVSPAMGPLSSSVDSVASMMDHYDDDTSNDIFVVVPDNTSSPEQEKENALYKRAQAEVSAARNGDVKNQHTSQQQKQRQPLGSSTTATPAQPTAPVITDDLTPANVWNAFVQVIDNANIQE